MATRIARVHVCHFAERQLAVSFSLTQRCGATASFVSDANLQGLSTSLGADTPLGSSPKEQLLLPLNTLGTALLTMVLT